MTEIERLRAFAASCIAAARTMSLVRDAARLREMAHEALAKAIDLEHAGLPRQAQQQQQQPQLPPKDQKEEP